MERDKHLSKFSLNCADSGRNRGVLARFLGPARPLRAVFSAWPDAHPVSVSHLAPRALKKFHIKALKNSWWRHAPRCLKEEHFAERLWRHLQPIECRIVVGPVGSPRGWVRTWLMFTQLHEETRRHRPAACNFDLYKVKIKFSYQWTKILRRYDSPRFMCVCLSKVNKHKQRIHHIKTHQRLKVVNH